MKDIINIFEYEDYRKFLIDKFGARKKISEAFSHRYFAKKAGLQTSNYLKLVMQGKRNLTRESIRRFAHGFDLSGREFRYFEAMVLFNQASAQKEKENHYREMLELKRRVQGTKITQNQYDYYSKWYVPVIREMVDLPGFKPSTKWVREKLLLDIPVSEITKAFKLLVQLGFIQKTPDRSYEQTQEVVSTGPDATSVQTARWHKEMLPVIAKAIDSVPANDREISSLTATVSRECYAEIKKRIREFKQDMIQLIVDDKKERDDIYHLAFHLVPLIHKKRK